jgi:TRAP-type C4-dicarboxylate transport system substrate-binding protein
VARRLLTAFALAALALVAVASLAHGSAERTGPPGKSGGTAGVALRLAVLEYPGKPAAQIAERYARRVEDLSNGSMRVTINYWPIRFEPTTPSGLVEASAIRALRAGELQLGLIPSHAFEAQGVSTFRALQAPLLITTSAQAARVTTGPLAHRLHAGLPRIALTGLGLVPEGLHRPFGFLKPLVSPADFAGLAIRADSSRATRDVLRVLGARPVAPDTAGSDTSVFSGFVNDATSLPSADDVFPQAAYTAGNFALFPKIDVIVASARAFGRLRPEQRSVLRRAAAEARAASIPGAGEHAAAAAFCRAGGTIVAATPDEEHALRTKVAPLLDAMRRDPATRATIASIEQLVDVGTPVRPCGPGQPSIASSSDHYPNTVRDALLPPVGSYRRTFTAAQLRAAGAGDADVRRNLGVTTLTFAGPRYRLDFAIEWRSPTDRPRCRGRVDLVDRRVRLSWNPATPCAEYIAFSWKRTGRDLAIVALDPRTATGWTKAFLGTWKLVDCTPTGPEWPVCQHHRDPRVCGDVSPPASPRPC